MRRTVDILCLVFAIVSLMACYEDKGNYDYTELNEISVVSPSAGTYFAIDRYETLHIEPQLAFTQGEMDDSQLDFLWEMYLDDWRTPKQRLLSLAESAFLMPSFQDRRAQQITPWC